MDKKWLPLAVVLGAAGVAVVTAGLWPDEEEPPPARTLCHGVLSRQTAELIDDGKGGEVSAEEWESKGQGGLTVFKGCGVTRADPDTGDRRGTFNLIIEDSRNDPGPRKDSVPLGPGFTGWALPEEARATLPADCAARMGSTARYIMVTVKAPSQAAEKGLVDRDTAIRNSTAVVREAAANVAEKYGCGA